MTTLARTGKPPASFGYDAKGNVVTGFGYSSGETSPLGLRSASVHDAAGRPVDTKLLKKQQDRKTLVLQWSKTEYDPLGRVCKEIAKLFTSPLELPLDGSEPAGATDIVARMIYNDAGRKTTAIDSRGNATISDRTSSGASRKSRTLSGTRSSTRTTAMAASGARR